MSFTPLRPRTLTVVNAELTPEELATALQEIREYRLNDDAPTVPGAQTILLDGRPVAIACPNEDGTLAVIELDDTAGI